MRTRFLEYERFALYLMPLCIACRRYGAVLYWDLETIQICIPELHDPRTSKASKGGMKVGRIKDP